MSGPKDLSACSGPWLGWSIQDGIRIAERLQLQLHSNQIDGSGCDKDGDFIITGSFDARTQVVRLTRRYTWTTEPSQEGVGIPYEYNGTWDGATVSGTWNPRTHPGYGGPFEMWPESESLTLELESEVQEALTHSG